MKTPLAVMTLSLAALAGCASNPSAGPDRAPGPLAPVELSLLREDALAELQRAASDADPQQRANAVEAFSNAPARAAAVCRLGMADDHLAVRFVAAMTAGELRDPSLRPAAEALLRDPSPVVRAAAVYASRTLGGSADPTELGSMLLSARDTRQRAQAAFILGELGDDSAVPLLREAAKADPATATLAELRLFRLQIAEALAKLGNEEAVETVRAALYPSRPEELEAAALACQILGEIGDRRSIDQLIYLIERDGADRMPAEVRLAAAGALAQLGEPGGAFVAAEYTDHENPALRAQAAAVIGLIGSADHAEQLRDTLLDPDPLVRISAAAAVLKLRR